MAAPQPRPDRRKPVVTLFVALVPGLLAMAAPWVADLLPLDTIETWAAASILWMAPAWLGVLWAVWALAVGLRGRVSLAPAIMALAGLGMAGVPLSVLHAAEDPGEGTPGLEVLAANVNAFSPATTDADRLALEAALTADRAAVVLVLEKRPLALPGYVRAADNFDDDLPRASHATAIFCREDVSCAAEVTAEFGSDTSQMPLGWVRVQGALAAPVCLGALHAPPPVPKDPTGHLPHIRQIAGQLRDGRLDADRGPCRAGDPVVLAGDLNAVPRSPGHAILLGAGLRDGLDGAGLFAASWPGGGGWPDLPYFHLDHVLLGPVGLVGVRHRTIPGADHRGLRFVLTDPS